MRMFKKVLGLLCGILLTIQIIRPAKNRAAGAQPADINTMITVPQPVATILVKACYDCHSNNSHYPWYFNIQPVAWWMAHHIDEGKAELNFSEFAGYPLKKQVHKFEEIAEEVKEGAMPLDSYTWTHAGTRLTKEETATLVSWAKTMEAELSKRLPQ
jgi:hypothetical protein